MSGFKALNIESDDESDVEVDDTKEIQIEETLKLEETRFRQTLANGLRLLDEATGAMNPGDTLPGRRNPNFPAALCGPRAQPVRLVDGWQAERA